MMPTNTIAAMNKVVRKGSCKVETEGLGVVSKVKCTVTDELFAGTL